MVNAELAPGGELSCEGQIVGRLQGFRFTPETPADAPSANIEAADIADAVVRELDARAHRLSEAVDGSLVLANDGAIRWLGDPIAKLVNGDHLFAPRVLLLADDSLSETGRQKAQARVDLWVAAYVKRLLGPLFELEAAVGLEGAARNVALQVAQALGVLERGRVAQDVKSLDQTARGALRKLGVRFGAYYIYLPLLVKPAIRALATQLWALRQGGAATGLDELPQFAASGRTSFVADTAISRDVYRVAGFRLCEGRAVRVDIVERLADLIRPAVAYRPGVSAGQPPPGSADGDSFVVTGAMTSLTGCSGESFAAVLRSLGFVSRRVKGPALTLAPPAAVETGLAEASPASSDPAALAGSAEGSGGPAAAQVGEIAVPSADTAELAAPIETSSDVVEAAAPAVAAEAAPARAVIEAPGAVAAPETEPVDSPVESASVESPAAGESADPVESQPASGPSEAGASEEEPLIEVWRPRPAGRQRHPRSGTAQDRRRPRPAPEGAAQAEGRETATGKAARRGRSFFRAPPQPGAEASPAPKEEARKHRGDGARRERAEASGGAGLPKGRDGDSNKGGAPPRGRPDRPAGPVGRREPPVNMDSPFAKLLALKSQLEAKGKGG